MIREILATLWSRHRKRRTRHDFRLNAEANVRGWARWLIVGGTAVILVLLFPQGRSLQFADLEEGSVSTRRVVAPFDFEILKTENQIRTDREQAVRDIVTSFTRDESVRPDVMNRLNSILDEIKRVRKLYPRAPLVLYVNTLAVAKAYCDICCTSANVIKVIESLSAGTILFGPDRNLAEYAQRKTGKTIIPVPEWGFCPTHLLFQPEDVYILKKQYPDALVMVHPECNLETQKTANFVGSTSQMCKFAKENNAKTFIVGTEEGLLHRLRNDNPEKQFILAYEDATCPNMKLNTLDRLCASLKEEKHLVTVPPPIADKARKALEKMLEVK